MFQIKLQKFGNHKVITDHGGENRVYGLTEDGNCVVSSGFWGSIPKKVAKVWSFAKRGGPREVSQSTYVLQLFCLEHLPFFYVKQGNYGGSNTLGLPPKIWLKFCKAACKDFT